MMKHALSFRGLGGGGSIVKQTSLAASADDDDDDAMSLSAYSIRSLPTGEEGGSGSGGGSTTGSQYHNSTMGGLGKKETKRLMYTKSLVVFVLFASAVGISYAIYTITRQSEMNEFYDEFYDQSQRIMEEFSISLLHSIKAVDNLGVTITSHVSSMNLQWPYAYVPEFDIRGDSTNSLSQAAFLGFYPLVTKEHRIPYEEYTVELSVWIDQAVARMNGLPVPESSPMMMMDHDGMRSLKEVATPHHRDHHHHHQQQQQQLRLLQEETTTNMDMNMDNMGSDTMPGDMDMNAGTGSDGMTTMESGMDMGGMTMGSSNSTSSTMVGGDSGTNHTIGMESMNHTNMGAQDNSEGHNNMDHSNMNGGDSTTMDHSNMNGGGDGGNTMEQGTGDHSSHHPTTTSSSSADLSPYIFYLQNDKDEKLIEDGDGPFFPLFECTPVLPNALNFNLLSHQQLGPEAQIVIQSEQIVVGKVIEFHHPDNNNNNEEEMMDMNMEHQHHNDVENEEEETSEVENHNDHHQHRRRRRRTSTTVAENPQDPFYEFLIQESKKRNGEMPSQILFPIFDTFSDTKNLSGMLATFVYWSDFFSNHLPETVQNVIGVLENGCGQILSYEIHSMKKATFLGMGDYHDTTFDTMKESVTFQDFFMETNNDNTGSNDNNSTSFMTYSGATMKADYCPFTLHIYPSSEMKQTHLTRKPIFYTCLVAMSFIFTALALLGYDWLVERRQTQVMAHARHTSQVISSLFPAVVRERLFGADDMNRVALVKSAKHRIKNYLNETGEDNQVDASKPIADLFTDTTVLFADISGFTAWSSIREPSQVFTLLETIYGSFDKLCRKRNVFKVETIGDCFVAVTGLPNVQPDHAVIMAGFAHECLQEFETLTKNLEVSLGPDTGELMLRVGLNSGPVTAGVLRGAKSRFQLFGDTVNTAARMESTGEPGRIQCSQATADLLMASDTQMGVQQRDDIVAVKGKGDIRTYWVNPGMMIDMGAIKTLEKAKASMGGSVRFVGGATDSGGDFSTSKSSDLWGDTDSHKTIGIQERRLVEWHVETLSKLIKQIISQRSNKDRNKKNPETVDFELKTGSNPLDEYADSISMPRFDAKKAKKFIDPESIVLSAEVLSQLRDFVSMVAKGYKPNSFHNFAHASHVTMAANKLLSRIVAAEDIYNGKVTTKTLAVNLHGYTYGITSDPITQFACAFSALIHDLDHCGVSNGQLVKENTESAQKYGGKCVAEQNSVDIAWAMLMDPSLSALRGCIYTNEAEYTRFRQLVVNSVLATDIFDKDLKEKRNKRWDRAFHQQEQVPNVEESEDDDLNLKATIVIEHIIQAADVAHTMQHWHVYQKFNKKLFGEMYNAFKEGRGGEKNPAEGWYKGELWFFDNYVIPLAKKLKECGVFGVASAECLTYAVQNRLEWESKGEDIVESFVKEFASSEEDVNDETTDSTDAS